MYVFDVGRLFTFPSKEKYVYLSGVTSVFLPTYFFVWEVLFYWLTHPFNFTVKKKIKYIWENDLLT